MTAAEDPKTTRKIKSISSSFLFYILSPYNFPVFVLVLGWMNLADSLDRNLKRGDDLFTYCQC
jgi:hypothetical protein